MPAQLLGPEREVVGVGLDLAVLEAHCFVLDLPVVEGVLFSEDLGGLG